MKLNIKVQLPEKMAFLMEPATAERGRYKVVYGGRLGLKTWNVARTLLIRGTKKKRRNRLQPDEKETDPIVWRVWCAREIQESIEESVYFTLVDQIKRLRLEPFYVVEKNRIYGRSGTTAEGTDFFFKGLHYNIEEKKSMEGVDVLWIDEANLVTKYAWEILIPTIRKEYDDGTCSEIIVTFNPDLETDEAYRRFVVLKNRPKNAIVVQTSYRDNPWLSEVMKVTINELREKDPDEYLVVYEGQTRQALQGAVFAKELRNAKAAGRICQFEVDRAHPVDTFWDLGKRDKTSIWFIQRVGMQWRVVDFYENNQEDIPHYLGVLQAKNYVYRTFWLPHDGKAKILGMKRTVQAQVQGLTDDNPDRPLRDVRIVPQHTLTDQHNALRTIFPNMWFEADRVSEGLSRLGRYCYEVDDETKQLSLKPLHDENSHAASALMQFAVTAREPEKMKRPVDPLPVVDPFIGGHAQGWLG